MPRARVSCAASEGGLERGNGWRRVLFPVSGSCQPRTLCGVCVCVCVCRPLSSSVIQCAAIDGGQSMHLGTWERPGAYPGWLPRCPTGPLALPRVRVRHTEEDSSGGGAGRGLRHNASPTPSRGLVELLLLHWGRGRFDGPRDAHPFEEISRPATSSPAACRLACRRLRCVVGVEAQQRRAMPIGLFPAPCSLWPQVSFRGALRSTYYVAGSLWAVLLVTKA